MHAPDGGHATPALNTSQLLRDLGGVSAVHRKLEILGFHAVPSIVQMRKWVTRRSMPCKWLLVLLLQAKEDGRDLDLTDYVIER